MAVIYEIFEIIDALYVFTLDKNKSLIMLFIIQLNQNFNVFVLILELLKNLHSGNNLAVEMLFNLEIRKTVIVCVGTWKSGLQ